EALAIRQHKLAPESDEVVRTLNDLLYAYLSIGNNRLAEPLARQSLAILERQYGAKSAKIVDPLIRLANVCWRQGKHQEAQELFRRVQPLLSGEPRAAMDHVDHAFYELAQAYFSQADYDRIEKLLRESLAKAEKQYGPDDPAVACWLD